MLANLDTVFTSIQYETELQNRQRARSATLQQLGNVGPAGPMVWTLTAPSRKRTGGRMSLLIALLIAGLLATMPFAVIHAQDATPVEGGQRIPSFLQEYTAAWSSGDSDRVLRLYDEDALFEELVLGGVVTRNHQELAAYADAAFGAFTDFAITVHWGIVKGNVMVAEWVLSGSYTGTFGDLPQGTGQQVEVPGVSIIEVENGLIKHQREYWDVAMLLSQVGVL